MADRNVLIIDDDAACRESLRLLLQTEGCHVQAVAGMEELVACECVVPSVLIADLSLGGGVSGLEVAQRLLAKWPKMRVIFISGYLSQGGALPEENLPNSQFLAKPFAPEALLEAVLDSRSVVTS